MSVLESKSNGKAGAAKGQPAQVIGFPKRKHVSASSGLNRHIKAAIIRLTFDSCLDIKRFANIAKYAGTREEVALSVLREYVRDLRAGGGLTPPSGPANIRRAA
jgi:hypothetical protein